VRLDEMRRAAMTMATAEVRQWIQLAERKDARCLAKFYYLTVEKMRLLLMCFLAKL
jgi:hypothetical protein